jgi:pilus assembly protein Flp/PilA
MGPPHYCRVGFGDQRMKLIHRFVTNDNGATAIEYALIASLIALVIITAVKTIGTTLSATFASVSANLK